MTHYEIVESKEKDELAKATDEQLDHELNLELMAEVDKKRVAEFDIKR